MRKKLTVLLLILAAVSLVAVTDGFAQRYPRCEQCTSGYYDTGTGSFVPVCDAPDSGTWGSDTCHIDCLAIANDQICVCDDRENQCYYYQVCC